MDPEKSVHAMSQSLDQLASTGSEDDKKGSPLFKTRKFKVGAILSSLMVVGLVAVVCVLSIGVLDNSDGDEDVDVSQYKRYSMDLKDIDGNPFEGSVEVSVAKGEEIYRTGFTNSSSDTKVMIGSKSSGDATAEVPYLVRDVNKKLDAVVDVQNSVCFLSTYDANTEVTPSEFINFMDSHSPDEIPNSEEVIIENMEVSEDVIDDVYAESEVIAAHCADKDSYWTVATSQTVSCAGSACPESRSAVDRGRHFAVAQKTSEEVAAINWWCRPVCGFVLKKICKLIPWALFLWKLLCFAVARFTCQLVC
ncbi:uncharacterized protein [Ptychodera flava]|uniref:uncharacterized protein n=1 Tax=Ptychodera flava TaxID=63121 RepID=UPI003969E7C5